MDQRHGLRQHADLSGDQQRRNYETYTLTFNDAVGDGIRIDGAPGGSNDFVSVGELLVYGVPGGATPTP